MRHYAPAEATWRGILHPLRRCWRSARPVTSARTPPSAWATTRSRRPDPLLPADGTILSGQRVGRGSEPIVLAYAGHQFRKLPASTFQKQVHEFLLGGLEHPSLTSVVASSPWSSRSFTGIAPVVCRLAEFPNVFGKPALEFRNKGIQLRIGQGMQIECSTRFLVGYSIHRTKNCGNALAHKPMRLGCPETTVKVTSQCAPPRAEAVAQTRSSLTLACTFQGALRIPPPRRAGSFPRQRLP